MSKFININRIFNLKSFLECFGIDFGEDAINPNNPGKKINNQIDSAIIFSIELKESDVNPILFEI